MNLILVMIIIVILVIINFLRYKYNSLADEITNVKWYRYNFNNNGLYDVLEFTNGNINVYLPTDMNVENEFDGCTKYTFDKKDNSIKLDCKKDIKITEHDKNKLVLSIDNKKYVYFRNVDDSLNYEFELYFEKSMIDYKKEKEQVTEIIQINEEKLYEIIQSDEYSKVVFIGDKCTSVDCVLALDVVEKWISLSSNVYYYDVNELNNGIINYINKINNSSYNKDYYNNIYPRIIIFKNNKIVDQYEIKCNGFNCSKYYKNEF